VTGSDRKLAIIGGSGLDSLSELEATHHEAARTPWGEPSGPIVHGSLGDTPVAFLARHGQNHTIAPHKVNYRANLWALKEAGAERIVAVAAVGGIDPRYSDRRIAIPDQIIDYTWSRGHTFFGDDPDRVVHVDFTEPYCPELRGLLVRAARDAGIDVLEGGTYGVTQGPRFETAAEIERMARDGCHMVGMTGMPEAALARELALPYAHCAVIVNPAAGRGDGEVRMADIEANLKSGMAKARLLLRSLVRIL